MKKPIEQITLWKWLCELAFNYNSSKYGITDPLHTSEKWLTGTWMLGQDYKNISDFYGAYPRQLLKRYEITFWGIVPALHLFSGSLPSGNYDRFDIDTNLDAEYYGNAEELSQIVPNNYYKIIFADPPYRASDAEKYGFKMPYSLKVVKECVKCLQPGGLLVWLDIKPPMYRRKELIWFGLITVVLGVNKLNRVVHIYMRR